MDGEGLEFHICHAPSNIGIMWFRSNTGSQQLTEEWVKRIEKDDSLWDQNAFNDLKGLDGGCQYTPDGTGLGPGYGGKVQAGYGTPIQLHTCHRPAALTHFTRHPITRLLSPSGGFM